MTSALNRETQDELRFLSLGMVVLDQLRFPDRETLYDIPGGSGTYGEYM